MNNNIKTGLVIISKIRRNVLDIIRCILPAVFCCCSSTPSGSLDISGGASEIGNPSSSVFTFQDTVIDSSANNSNTITIENGSGFDLNR
jgi:hypothetical protein